MKLLNSPNLAPGSVVWDTCFNVTGAIAWTVACAMPVIQDTWSQHLFKICATSPVGVFPLNAKIISWAMWQEAVLALRYAAEQRSVCCSRWMAYVAGDCVCLGKQQQTAEQGVVGDSHQGQCSASSEAGRCADRLPWPAATLSKSLSQSRGDACRPEPLGLCYSTGKRDNGLAFDISVTGGGAVGGAGVVCWT